MFAATIRYASRLIQKRNKLNIVSGAWHGLTGTFGTKKQVRHDMMYTDRAAWMDTDDRFLLYRDGYYSYFVTSPLSNNAPITFESVRSYLNITVLLAQVATNLG
jgi:hypothetical protein